MRWLRNLFGGARVPEVIITNDGMRLTPFGSLTKEQGRAFAAAVASNARCDLPQPEQPPAEAIAPTQAMALPSEGVVLVKLHIASGVTTDYAKKFVERTYAALSIAQKAAGSNAQIVLIPVCREIDVSVVTLDRAPVEA